MNGSAQTLEAVAAVLGLLYVWLLARGDSRGWPVGCLTALLSGAVYWIGNIWGQVYLNAFFFALQVVGWWRWGRGKRSETDMRDSSRLLTGKERLLLLVAWLLASALLGALLTVQGSRWIWLDAFATVGSVLGQIMIVVGFAESWLVYLAADLVLVALSVAARMDFYAVMYLVYCGLAWQGWRGWTRDRQAESETTPPNL